MLYGPEEKCPNEEVIFPLRSAISRYLATLHEAFIYPAESLPPNIKHNISIFRELPLRQPNKQSDMEEKQLEFRRKLLKGMLENDGWHWDDMWLEQDYSCFDLERVKPEFPVHKASDYA